MSTIRRPSGEFFIRPPEGSERKDSKAVQFKKELQRYAADFLKDAKNASEEKKKMLADNLGKSLAFDYWAPAHGDRDRQELILNCLRSLEGLDAYQKQVIEQAMAVMEDMQIQELPRRKPQEDPETDGDMNIAA